ncbi:uncharacterized protein LOC121414779 [Lytechinus variegatus]|uniref:uncharacterized protein LOC121414779 n=1 Tax=Lytechinus variegatus TaxID=7654 RepID=UPI001BB14207|nr:uncharacterized protein LOC121414779 [Lytechinus variegatus]
MSTASDVSDEIYDICIIGAGITGSAAARWASSLQKNIKICLIGPNEPLDHEWDDPSRTIFGAHYDEGRVVTEICMNNIHDSWIEFTRRSIARFKDLEKESGISFFTEDTNITISDDSVIKELWRKRQDKSTAQCYQGDELSNAIPSFKPLPDGISAITETTNEGYMNPRAYIAANKLLASQNGCKIVEEVVLEVREDDNVPDDDGDDKTTKSSRRRVIARTMTGRVYRAQRILLCPGAFVNFDGLLPNGLEVDVSTTTERVVILEINDEDVEHLSKFPCGIVDLNDGHDTRNCYFLPAIKYPDGKYYMKIGHGPDMNLPLVSNDAITAWYKKKDDIPTTVQAELLSRFFVWAEDIKFKSTRTSTCVITNTPTRRFYCDMATSNIGIVVGGNGSGACVGDEIGRMGARMILKGAWDHDYPAELFKLRYKDKGGQEKST